MWNYVETHSSKCVLLILKDCDYHVCNGNSEKPYRLIYAVPSKKFLEAFGEIPWKTEYDSKHPFTAIVYDPPSSEIYEGEVELENIYGETVKMHFEAWYNSYNIFVLIREKSKTIIPKKRVLIHK